jgi:hypothetical protein
MKAIKKFEFPTSTGGAAQSKYDWNKLFDGGIYQLTHGEDVTSDPHNFRMLLQKQAEASHKNVKVHISKDTPAIITLQASPMTDEEAAEADARVANRKDAEKARRLKKAEAKKASATTPETVSEAAPVATPPQS